MTKVLICSQHGGFNLSRGAFLRLRELGSLHALAEPDYGEFWDDGSGPRVDHGLGDGGFCSEIPRDDELLHRVYGEMGGSMAGIHCTLSVVDVPDDASWHVEEYDGLEHVAEDHRTWA